MLVAEPTDKRPPILLAYGFRPFFLATGIYGLGVIAWWLAVHTGHAEVPTPFDPLLWHGHEMVFGFIAAAVGGFLLTAVPNWTTTAPATGKWLAPAVFAWLAGRLAIGLAGHLPYGVVAGVDLAYFPVLAFLVGRPILHAANPRHYAFPGLLVVLFAANLLMHLEIGGATAGTARPGLYLGIYVIALILALVAGRIVPNFTRNALRAQGIEASVETDERIEKGAIGALLLTAVVDVAGGSALATGFPTLVAGILFLLRMRKWQTGKVLGQPILWVLHLGHFWLGAGFAIKGLGDLTGFVPATTAFHGLFIGAFATMILAVMTRAALGHSGRPLVVARPIVLAYLLVSGATLLRVFGPALAPAHHGTWVVAAGFLWLTAFALFLAVYWPILTRPRLDGRPG